MVCYNVSGASTGVSVSHKRMCYGTLGDLWKLNKFVDIALEGAMGKYHIIMGYTLGL